MEEIKKNMISYWSVCNNLKLLFRLILFYTAIISFITVYLYNMSICKLLLYYNQLTPLKLFGCCCCNYFSVASSVLFFSVVVKVTLPVLQLFKIVCEMISEIPVFKCTFTLSFFFSFFFLFKDCHYSFYCYFW